ncbi:hypothetical protein MP228_012628 [Amoeboaphelidium protococcarum]|nr:hypothetical protein MP228_012628 [Amoeboaphelidium protococcarum]
MPFTRTESPTMYLPQVNDSILEQDNFNVMSFDFDTLLNNTGWDEAPSRTSSPNSLLFSHQQQYPGFYLESGGDNAKTVLLDNKDYDNSNISSDMRSNTIYQVYHQVDISASSLTVAPDKVNSTHSLQGGNPFGRLIRTRSGQSYHSNVADAKSYINHGMLADVNAFQNDDDRDIEFDDEKLSQEQVASRGTGHDESKQSVRIQAEDSFSIRTDQFGYLVVSSSLRQAGVKLKHTLTKGCDLLSVEDALTRYHPKPLSQLQLQFEEGDQLLDSVKTPKPPNAFIIYRGCRHKELKQSCVRQIISRVVAKLWKLESKQVTEHYQTIAKLLREEYKRFYSDPENLRRDYNPLQSNVGVVRTPR